MDTHYNAFISYRHHPEDIRVATQIHRALERFRVPKALRGKAKLPMRLFRDKDELPITSNLSDDIFAALENSDYLIVICSVHTRESMWVQREIETFLKTHSLDKVLTVLVNGEPDEVIPEILRYRQVADPETGETVCLPVEPLSCDWRMGYRKAVKEELPRLAAALLHCGYDELRQRQKQYRMKQLIALISAALTASVALSAYFLHTTITIRNANIQIQENLDQALRNQSIFLSTAAEEKLEEGDRLTALALLLEALPGEENPRPYVADAEYMLTEALGVYSSQTKMIAQGALIPSDSAMVYDFVQTMDGETVFLRDSRSIITGWDAQTMQRICIIEPGGTMEEMIGTTYDSGILFSMMEGSRLYCFSREGQPLWQLEKIQDAVLSADGRVLYAIHIPQQEQRELLVVDIATGELLRESLPLDLSPSGGLAYEFALESIREEAALIPVVCSAEDRMLCLLDPKTGVVTELCELPWSIRAACETGDGSFLFMIGDGTGQMNGIYEGNVYLSSPSGSDIFCYDPEGSLLWTSKITTCQYNGQHTLCPVPGSDMIFCQTGDTLQLIRSTDGSVIQSCSAICSAIGIASVGEKKVMGILEDGCIFSYDYAQNLCNAVDYNMESNLRKAEIGKNIFTLSWESGQVTSYDFSDILSQWEFPLTENGYADQFRTAGEDLVFRMGDEICLFDVRQRDFRWRISPYYMKLCDFSGDGSVIWAIDGYTTLYGISAQSGEMQEYSIPRTWKNVYLSVKEEPRLYDDSFWFLASSEQKLRLFRFQPLTGETTCWEILSTGVEVLPEVVDVAESSYGLETYLQMHRELNDGAEHPSAAEIRQMIDALPEFLRKTEKACLAGVNGNLAWIMDGEGTLLQLELDTGNCRTLLADLTSLPPIAVRESDGAVAVAADNAILLYVPGDEQPHSVQLSNERGGSLCFRGDELLVVCDSGYLLCFDKNLQQCSRVGLTVNSSFSTGLFSRYSDARDITWKFVGDNKLYLNLFQTMNVVDCDQWSSNGYVSLCVMYDSEGDQFLCVSDDIILGYPRYDTDELIALTRQQLGSFRLSQEQKGAYGIN